MDTRRDFGVHPADRSRFGDALAWDSDHYTGMKLALADCTARVIAA
jgi:hypothetical protein